MENQVKVKIGSVLGQEPRDTNVRDWVNRVRIIKRWQSVNVVAVLPNGDRYRLRNWKGEGAPPPSTVGEQWVTADDNFNGFIEVIIARSGGDPRLSAGGRVEIARKAVGA